MKLAQVLPLAMAAGASAAALAAPASQYLNISATAAADGKSVIQCWQLANPFKVSTEKGTVGTSSLSLGNLTNGVVTILPAGFNSGPHPAPSNQFVVFLSGLARITVSGEPEGLVLGGETGILFASDIKALSPGGHNTEYLAQTVALELPTLDGKIPEHKVLHKGGCTGQDLLH